MPNQCTGLSSSDIFGSDVAFHLPVTTRRRLASARRAASITGHFSCPHSQRGIQTEQTKKGSCLFRVWRRVECLILEALLVAHVCFVHHCGFEFHALVLPIVPPICGSCCHSSARYRGCPCLASIYRCSCCHCPRTESHDLVWFTLRLLGPSPSLIGLRSALFCFHELGIRF